MIIVFTFEPHPATLGWVPLPVGKRWQSGRFRHWSHLFRCSRPGHASACSGWRARRASYWCAACCFRWGPRGPGARRGCAFQHRRTRRAAGLPAGAAGPAVPPAARRTQQRVPVPAGRRLGRYFAIRRRVFSYRQGSPPGLLCLQYHVFLASMGFVLLADDAYGFMVSWETMALSSYFLVTTQHRIPEIRSAGFLYLLIAHLGAISSCWLRRDAGRELAVHLRRHARPASRPAWAAVAFCSRCSARRQGGARSAARVAARSPSGGAVAGLRAHERRHAQDCAVRLAARHLRPAGRPAWWWGLIPLALGLFTAIYGVVFAAAQTDMKRLLAFSSIENIGIMFTGVGLAIVFRGVGMTSLAALALIAVLYHAVNHAFMKSLLFLATGSVLHATGQRNLGRLGGLIHRMPWVAWLTLIGVLAIGGSAAAQRFRVRVAAAAGLPLGARSPADRSSTCCCRSVRR